MQNDRPAVRFSGDQVDGGSGDLHAVVQGLFMDVEAIGPFPAERGDEGGVDVENFVGVGLDNLLGEDSHKARQHHHVCPHLLKKTHQGPGIGLIGGPILPGQDVARDIGLFGSLQGVGLRAGGDHHANFPAVDLSPVLGVDEGL